jgi:signal peptidase I
MRQASTIRDRSPEAPAEPESDPGPTLIQTPPAARRRRPLIREIIETVIIVIVVYAGLRSFVLPYRVDGSSMTPYLINGERLFVSRTAYTHIDANAIWNVLPWEDREGSAQIFPFSEPERGDIIVLEPPVVSSEPFIKRVIGLPGERITFADGLVFVNGEVLTEDYIRGAITACERTPFCSVTIPPGEVFVLGDNRANSADSRVFGTIPYDHIIGKAIFSNWPFETIGPIDDPAYELTAPVLH